jgi:cytochrome P450
MALLEINAAFFYTFFVGLLLVFAYCSRWRRYFQLGMKLPGPPALPIIGNCLQFTTNDLCKLFQELMAFARSYGPIARLWIGPVLVVALTDPDNIENLVKHDQLLTRGYIVRKLGEPIFRNGLACIDGDQWRRHRKIVSAALHVNILEKFVESFSKNSDILANKLKAIADGITAHDIVPYLKRCTLDVIVQTSSKSDFNAQNDNDDSKLNSMTTIIDTTAIRFMKPWFYIDWIFKASELGKKYYKAVKHCHELIINDIEKDKRMGEISDNKYLINEKPSLKDILIQYADIGKEEIVGEISTIIGAGSDTISVACGYALALLGENQHIQERVVQEQRDIFGDDILRPVRSDDLPRMVYLEQVGNCLLRSSLFSRTIAIFLHYIK